MKVNFERMRGECYQDFPDTVNLDYCSICSRGRKGTGQQHETEDQEVGQHEGSQKRNFLKGKLGKISRE
jgi:hypothetical protein